MLALIYDTETTGLPLWDQPSGDPAQPHLVQIAAALVCTDTRRDLAAINLTITPDGWDIPDDVVAVHGLTVDHCNTCGVPEVLALQVFMDLWHRADIRVGHAESFDARMLRIALKRYATDERADLWKSAPAFCTYAAAKKHMPKLGPKGSGSLKAVHRYYTGEDFEDVHTAEADMRATARVYFAMLEKGHV